MNLPTIEAPGQAAVDGDDCLRMDREREQRLMDEHVQSHSFILAFLRNHDPEKFKALHNACCLLVQAGSDDGKPELALMEGIGALMERIFTECAEDACKTCIDFGGKIDVRFQFGLYVRPGTVHRVDWTHAAGLLFGEVTGVDYAPVFPTEMPF